MLRSNYGELWGILLWRHTQCLKIGGLEHATSPPSSRTVLHNTLAAFTTHALARASQMLGANVREIAMATR